jgi:hypothetical protein
MHLAAAGVFINFLLKGNNVKTHDLTKSLCAALLVASPIVVAEPQYPAANFEPVIITQDADLIAKHSQAAKERASAETASAPNATAKNTQTAISSASTKPSKTAAAEVAPVPVQKEESSMEIFPIVLVVLALGGLVFWNSRRPASAVPQTQVAPAAVSGGTGTETGVAKYIKSLPPKAPFAETGVAKYLKALPEKVTATPAETGVTKYLKALPEKATKGETGVAKYLKGLESAAS